MGTHVIHTWSSTQHVTSWPVGDSYYYGMVKGTTMGMDINSLLSNMGLGYYNTNLKVCTDSSTAKIIALRQGRGTVRQIEVCRCWIQQEVSNGRIEIAKVKGDIIISDLLTNHVDNHTMSKHLRNMASYRRTDRHPLNPQRAQDN